MRRGPSLKRKPEPDPIYNSLLVSQLINQVLLDGKKDLASNIVYSALELVEKQTGSDPLNTLKDAFENVKVIYLRIHSFSPQCSITRQSTPFPLYSISKICKIIKFL